MEITSAKTVMCRCRTCGAERRFVGQDLANLLDAIIKGGWRDAPRGNGGIRGADFFCPLCWGDGGAKKGFGARRPKGEST